MRSPLKALLFAVSLVNLLPACVSARDAAFSTADLAEQVESDPLANTGYIAMTLNLAAFDDTFRSQLLLNLVDTHTKVEQQLRVDIGALSRDAKQKLVPVVFRVPSGDYKVTKAQLAMDERFIGGGSVPPSWRNLPSLRKLPLLQVGAGDLLHIGQLDVVMTVSVEGHYVVRKLDSNVVKRAPDSEAWAPFADLQAKLTAYYHANNDGLRAWSPIGSQGA